jgi:hypothetical protein
LRKDLFELVGGFGGIEIAEDRDWGVRATAAGARIDYVPELRIQTTARTDFGELRRKWDRHIGHDFEKVSNPVQKFKWVLRALALAASPILEIPRILTSNRVAKMRDRIAATLILARIRMYRALRMQELAVFGGAKEMYEGWRQNGR